MTLKVLQIINLFHRNYNFLFQCQQKLFILRLEVRQSAAPLDGWKNAMYIPNPNMYFTAPTKVIGFQYYAKRAGVLFLQILRPAGSYKYKLIYYTRHYAPSAGLKTVKVFLLCLSVQYLCWTPCWRVAKSIHLIRRMWWALSACLRRHPQPSF